MVGVDLSEDCVHILVSDWEPDVVSGEEAGQEFAQLAAVEPGIAIGVVLIKVLLNFLCQLCWVCLEVLELD